MKKTYKSITAIIAAAAITASALSVGVSASCFDYSQYINGNNPYSTNYFAEEGIDTSCGGNAACNTCTICGEEVTADCVCGTCDAPEICTTCGEEITYDCVSGKCDNADICTTCGEEVTDDCADGSCEDATPTAPATPARTQTTYYNSSNWLYNIFASIFGYNTQQTTPSAPSQPSTPSQPAVPSQSATPGINMPVITDEAACAEYAREMLVMINEARAEAGAKPLQLSAELCKAADIRAEETAASFSHTRPDGSSFSTVLDDINYSGSRACGENIAAGNSTVSATFTQWMNSQGHYENMVNANYKYVGIGYYKTSMGYRFYWAQIFSY